MRIPTHRHYFKTANLQSDLTFPLNSKQNHNKDAFNNLVDYGMIISRKPSNREIIHQHHLQLSLPKILGHRAHGADPCRPLLLYVQWLDHLPELCLLHPSCHHSHHRQKMDRSFGFPSFPRLQCISIIHMGHFTGLLPGTLRCTR